MVKYEDLVNEGTKYETLRNVARFIGFELSNYQVACAFAKSDLGKFLRPVSTPINFMYSVYPRIICDVWQNVKEYSTMFGYFPFNSTDCD
jgi:hypothetical protein